MRTHVQFRSAKFPAYPGEEEEINPNLWGKRLAEFMEAGLKARGIGTTEIFSEDWGWRVWLKHEAFPLYVCCGHSEEADDAYVVFIDPWNPIVRKGLFKKIDTTADVARVADAIDSILTSDPEIHDVRWARSKQ